MFNYIMTRLLVVLFLVLVIVLLNGCGPARIVTHDNDFCIVEQLVDGTYISCPDSDVFIPVPVDESDPGSDEIVECKRGKGHKKHTHEHHEDCEQ